MIKGHDWEIAFHQLLNFRSVEIGTEDCHTVKPAVFAVLQIRHPVIPGGKISVFADKGDVIPFFFRAALQAVQNGCIMVVCQIIS